MAHRTRTDPTYECGVGWVERSEAQLGGKTDNCGAHIDPASQLARFS